MAQQTDHIGDINKMATAVEWLVKELNLEGYDYTISQAEQIEKQNIAKAWDAGHHQYFCSKITNEDFDNGEEYYEENYKK